MGQGFYFNSTSAIKAQQAARLFEIKVVRNFHARVNSLGTTRTLGGRYISGVDVCGPFNPRLIALHKEIQEGIDNG